MSEPASTGPRARPWWKRPWLWILAAFITAGGLLALILAAYNWPWAGLTGYESNGQWQHFKTAWDWAELCLVPVLLALAAAGFTLAANKREREVELDRSRENALQTYFDRMSDLLLHGGLVQSERNSDVRSLAVARTLSVIRDLDGARKASVLKFLYDAQLIRKRATIVPLRGAQLSGAALSEAVLPATDLTRVDLSTTT